MDTSSALSGLLITSLLVAEWQRTGRIRSSRPGAAGPAASPPPWCWPCGWPRTSTSWPIRPTGEPSRRRAVDPGHTANWWFVFEARATSTSSPSRRHCCTRGRCRWRSSSTCLAARCDRPVRAGPPSQELWLTLAALAGALGSALLMAPGARRPVQALLRDGTPHSACSWALPGAARLAPRWRVPTVVAAAAPAGRWWPGPAHHLLARRGHSLELALPGGFLRRCDHDRDRRGSHGVAERGARPRPVEYALSSTWARSPRAVPVPLAHLPVAHARADGVEPPACWPCGSGSTLRPPWCSYHLVENPIRTGTFRLPGRGSRSPRRRPAWPGSWSSRLPGAGRRVRRSRAATRPQGRSMGAHPTRRRPPSGSGATARPRPARGTARAHAGQRAVPLAGVHGVSLPNAGTVGVASPRRP